MQIYNYEHDKPFYKHEERGASICVKPRKEESAKKDGDVDGVEPPSKKKRNYPE